MILLVLGSSFAFGGDREPIDIGIRFGYYQQIDSGGIPQVDEDARVIQGVFIVDAPVTDRDTIHVNGLVDIVSSASITREHNKKYRVLQSGASGVVHGGGGIGYAHRFDELELSVGVTAAFEYAYYSLGSNLGLSVPLFEKTATLTWGISGFYDTVRMIRFNGEDEPDETRWTLGTNLGWSHILTPTTLVALSLSWTSQGGMLAAQFNSVFLGNREAAEVLPGSRHRGSATLRLKQGFAAHHSVEIDGRYYRDTWGVNAATFNTGYSVYLDAAHRLLLNLGYRVHLQDAADDHSEEFASTDTSQFHTQDPDLGAFIGHMATVGFTVADIFAADYGDADFEANYYHRDNGLDMFWFAIGYRFSL
ncbi:MAG: hypothetical protein ACI9OJ_005816 [Myxococcota bacterium]|jgi:hypothetical protein